MEAEVELFPVGNKEDDYGRNAIPTAELKVKTEKCAIENEKQVKQSASAPLKQRVAKVLVCASVVVD